MNGKFRNLLVRTATGAVFVAVVLAAMLLGRLTFAVLLLCITAGCMWELYGLAEKGGAAPHKALGTLIGLLIVGINLGLYEAVNNVAYFKYIGAAFVLVILLGAGVFAADVWRRRGNALSNVGATFLGVVYVAVPVSLIALFPLVGNRMLFPWNPLIPVAFILTVWANDVFAYLFGVALGRRKLSERLSPRKTWAGFFGGLAGAVAVGTVVGKFLVGDDVWLWMGLGLLVGLAAVLGDLVESNFKRSVGAKDSGEALPGHGGLLDRFDAMLAAAPPVFLFFLAILVANGEKLVQSFMGLL